MTEPVMTDSPAAQPTPHPETLAPDSRSTALRVVLLPLRALGAVGRFVLHRRTPIILLVLLAGLGYAAFLGARMLFSATPDHPPAARSVTCWDGSEAPRADCPAPDGADGLRWVFPSFRPKSGRCDEAVFSGRARTRPTQYDCVVRLQGKPVTLTYSQRSTLTRGLSYFTKRYPGIKPRALAGGDRLRYRDAAPRPDGTFEVTVGYARYPYAVTVGAESLRLADAALAQLVEFRPEANILVRPAG